MLMGLYSGLLSIDFIGVRTGEETLLCYQLENGLVLSSPT